MLRGRRGRHVTPSERAPGAGGGTERAPGRGLRGRRGAIGKVDDNIAALAIAIVKATLVVLIFMHVRWSPRLIPLVAAAGFFWLLVLFGGTLADYLTRAWISLPVPR